MFAGIKIDKVALDIELKTEPKDDVSDHNSLGPDLPDHDDDMSMNMDDRGPDWPIDSKIFFLIVHIQKRRVDGVGILSMVVCNDHHALMQLWYW